MNRNLGNQAAPSLLKYIDILSEGTVKTIGLFVIGTHFWYCCFIIAAISINYGALLNHCFFLYWVDKKGLVMLVTKVEQAT